MRNHLEAFSDISVFRPGIRQRQLWIERAREHLLTAYKPGTYNTVAEINDILQFQFGYFASELEKALNQILYSDFLRFFLFQYDQAAKVDSLYAGNQLSNAERRRWREIGPTFRRALKYLAEQIILRANQGLPAAREIGVGQFVYWLEATLICAEHMVEYYMESDQTYLLFPHQTRLEIQEDPSVYPIRLTVDSPCPTEISKRFDAWMQYRSKHEIDLNGLRSAVSQDETLGVAFQSSHGVSYLRMLNILSYIVNEAPAPNRDDIPAPNLDELVDGVAKDIGLSPKSVRTAIAGFSISREQMVREGRALWEPRQEYRAFRRGFFQFTDPQHGTYLTFSREMAKECLLQLLDRIAFQQCPPEWRSPEIDRALADLSNNAGRWFESVVYDHMSQLGWIGAKSIKNGIGQGEQRLDIPPDVGEIDYLGYSAQEDLLLVLECKLVSYAFEPKYHQKDIAKFTQGNDSYFARFQTKVDWVIANTADICEALSTLSGFTGMTTPSRLATAVITLFPTMASCFAPRFPCVSLKEVHMGYERDLGWPFVKGVFQL